MPSTYTSSLRIEIQAEGENNNDWGDRANSVFQQLEQAIAGYTSIQLSGATVTLTALDATTDQSRPAFLEFHGTLTSNVGVILPSVTKGYVLRNNTTGSFTITVKCTAGSGLVLPQGGFCPVVCNGASVFQAASRLVTLDIAGSTSLGSVLNVAGATSLASTLDVTGAASLNSTLVVEGAASMGSTLTVVGATSLGSTLTVVGAVSAASFKATDASLTRANLAMPRPAANIGYYILGTVTNTLAQIPSDNTKPQSTEGAFLGQTSILPSAATNLLRIQATGMMASKDAGASGTLALFRNGTADAIAAKQTFFDSVNAPASIEIVAYVSADAATSVDVSCRFGSTNGTTSITMNGTDSGQLYGGASFFTIEVTEILRP